MAETKPAISSLLADLKFEKKNRPQPRLPPNMTIHRRPIIHPPIASPYAGASVQKVVYVSRSTPVMAAVKRVKKLLAQVEKRAMQGVDLANGGGRDGMKRLAEASAKLGLTGEAVLVKASGRAIEQAVRVGDWFKTREDEVLCNVAVKTGSVLVIDDLVAADDGVEEEEEKAILPAAGEGKKEGEDTKLDGKDDVSERENSDLMEVDKDKADVEEEAWEGIEDREKEVDNKEKEKEKKGEDAGADEVKGGEAAETTVKAKRKRGSRGKRKRAVYDKDDMPEARTRWINTVEVAISLKG